ncbi:MAG: efflux RND transporter periplasmic adaptor subunit [Alphaproteobacteria bacterium]
MKKPILLGLAIIGVLVLAWLGKNWLNNELIEVTHPTRGPAVLAVYATGTVEATVMMPIAPRIAAKLVELTVDEGSKVGKGKLLARLEDTDLQSGLRQLQAQEMLAKKSYDRLSMLVKSGAISKAEYDSAKSAWESAKASSAKASTETNFMKLIAPNDGLIIKRDGEIGQLIPAQQPVFWLSCCAPLRISVEVNEEDIVQVKSGQEVLIRADAFPEQLFNGKVQSITPKGDPIARTYRVRVEFIGDVPLQIGMTAETNIIISKNDHALLVPSTAVSDHKLWLVKDNRLVQQEIKQGAKGVKSVEIINGVGESDVVAVQPTAQFTSGAAVRTHFATP